MPSFRNVFLAVFTGTALVLFALILNARRPAAETAQPSAAFVRASGKCAECHERETPAVVHEFAMSRHAASGVNCLDCHRPAPGQQQQDHRGFTIVKGDLTAANCQGCHATQYRQYLRSRHAAPAWAAVTGAGDFTAEEVAFAEGIHPGAVNRPPNPLVSVEGPATITAGCRRCHAVGKPNADGSIGSCTSCHARHAASVALARLPETCGQCHMGPDHSQIEIYHESKHGVLFNAQRPVMDLTVPARKLTTRQMPVPTCATCHMSGLEGQNVTHDTTERLSWFLFAPVSEKRPTYASGQAGMKEICLKCHTKPHIDRFYKEAEDVVAATNGIVQEAQGVMKRLADEKKTTPQPFDEPIDYLFFDMWHYDGRTAKHGAFMGGADYVQWHGRYQLVTKLTELKHAAAGLEGSARPSGNR